MLDINQQGDPQLSTAILSDPQLFVILFRIDSDLAKKARADRCSCGGRLDTSDLCPQAPCSRGAGGPVVTSRDQQTEALIERASRGDSTALAELFSRYRSRLETTLRLRIDPALRGRLDVSEVIAEALGEARRSISEFSRKSELSFFLWLRRLALAELIRVQKRHLGRDVSPEVSLPNKLPQADGRALASRLLGRASSIDNRVKRERQRANLEEALACLEPLDREILALRHLEEFTHTEAAQELGLDETTAKKTYLRALERLAEELAGIDRLPGYE